MVVRWEHMNKDLRTSVARALEQGVSRQELTALLTEAGWSETERTEALGAFLDSPHRVAIPKRSPLTIPKESYLYFMQVAFYVVTAIAFLILWFQYINLWIPDPEMAAYPYAQNEIRSLIRVGLSMLIVALPVVLGVSWLIGRHEATQPDAPENPIKQGFIYLGAIVASVTAAITLMITIFQGLSGEATGRFLLKVLAVFLVCGVTALITGQELRGKKLRMKMRAD